MEVREPAIAYSKQKISIEEYLEMENASMEKHEYYQGEIFAMSGEARPVPVSKEFRYSPTLTILQKHWRRFFKIFLFKNTFSCIFTSSDRQPVARTGPMPVKSLESAAGDLSTEFAAQMWLIP